MKAEDAFQSCIDAVQAGSQTPAECAAQYPQFADLEADLNAALALRAMQSLALSAAADRRIEARLRERASALIAAQQSAEMKRPTTLKLRWVIGPGLAASLLLAGVGTTVAAAASNPGDLLYGMKRADESAQVFLSPPSGRAFVYATLAQHRLDELSVVLRRPQPDAGTVTQLSGDLTGQTAQALALVDKTPQAQQANILSTLAAMTDQQEAILAAAAQTAPAAAQAGLQQALQASSAGHARAEQRLAQVLGSPTATATATASKTATATATASTTPTASPSVTATPLPTHSPPGQTDVPPGQTKIPPGQTHVPPGQTHVPPGQTHVPPGQTHVPPGQTDVPPGQTHVPPGQTKIPPGQQKTPKPTKTERPDGM